MDESLFNLEGVDSKPASSYSEITGYRAIFNPNAGAGVLDVKLIDGSVHSVSTSIPPINFIIATQLLSCPRKFINLQDKTILGLQ